MKISNKNSMFVECDMLEGNINRMCVTDDLKELNSMFEFASRRLDAIFHYNLKRFNEKIIVNCLICDEEIELSANDKHDGSYYCQDCYCLLVDNATNHKQGDAW